MAANRQLALTALECRALWLIADAGLNDTVCDLDQDMTVSAMGALDKVYRAHMGMGRRPTPPGTPKAGKPTDHLFKKKAS